jgi:hypothetical protein
LLFYGVGQAASFVDPYELSKRHFRVRAFLAERNKLAVETAVYRQFEILNSQPRANLRTMDRRSP